MQSLATLLLLGDFASITLKFLCHRLVESFGGVSLPEASEYLDHVFQPYNGHNESQKAKRKSFPMYVTHVHHKSQALMANGW